MRPNCPVCGSNKRNGGWRLDFLVPDGWTMPTTNLVCLCLSCGMIYYDNDRTQADYDEYYQHRYGYDGNLDPEKHVPRWEEVIEAVLEIEPDKEARIVDFGGGIGYVTKRLNDLGYNRAESVEVGDKLPRRIDLLLSIHVFEHLYDLRPVLEGLIEHMNPQGRFLVEVPDASEYYKICDLPMIDFQQVHINHFIPATLDRLFSNYGYSASYRVQSQLANWESSMYRALYEPDVAMKSYFASQLMVKAATRKSLEKLMQVTGPVIVWGCGPYAMHMLTRAPEVLANVIHFVDNDPAFVGATIQGKPVLEAPDADVPILVIAQQQQTGILKAIKDTGLNNEVIVI